MPQDAAELWGFVVDLPDAERLALLAHCAALTVNAVRGTHERGQGRIEHADRLARSLNLDMTRYWSPTATGYFCRVSKPQILDAVREGVSVAAADGIAALKKAAMAEAAAQRLAGSRWLPALLRTEPAA
jgi:ParB family chromosome partitioning protein